MSAGQCAMRKRNWYGWVLDYGVVFCDTPKVALLSLLSNTNRYNI